MKRRSVLIAAIIILAYAAAVSQFPKDLQTGKKEAAFLKAENLSCITKIENRTVRGASMSGLIENNSTVRILFGYYGCNEIARGEIAAYNYSGNENPIIKIVKGIPRDKFHLQKTDGGWNILINGEVAKNSQSEPYLLGESGYRMLSLYEKDYNGSIPENTYLLLGNLASGSLDSTRFGLVGKSEILGKVEPIT